jgi:hypothetical protein
MLPATDKLRHHLLPHPVSERGAIQGLVQELEVRVAHQPGQWLKLDFRLTGELYALQLPQPRPPVRTDGLWRHTCFEAFIGHAGASEYWEFNFSPSGAWAAYYFSAYREGMAPLMKGAPPVLRSHAGEEILELEATLDLSWMVRSEADVGLRLGLAAVVEDRARGISFWALKHPAEKPDFHHADGFAIDLG